MLGVTRLLCGTVTPGDALRFGRQSGDLPPHLLHYSRDKKPVIAWNVTRRCNLHCAHCYTDSFDRQYEGELTTEEAKAVIDDLADFGAPVVLFSGGEPLLRPDLPELVERAQARGIRSVISTNGTLLIHAVAQELKDLGVSYVGVSIDGPQPVHDRFRGMTGAFQEAMQGIRNCRDVGLRVGLRVTLTQFSYANLKDIFDIVDREDIPRVCFYHLAYAGRGDRIQKFDLSHDETRAAVDLIFARALDFARRGNTKDILTVDNHTDGVYLYLTVREIEPQRADEVLQMLRWQGGNQSGIAVGNIDPLGNVHADQFSGSHTFGNVRERPFSQIWSEESDPLLAALRDRRGRVKGRCARCRYFDICNGNLRARPESYYGDFWAEDPACYLSDAELGIVPEEATAG
jgi:radical SAM protein with 4Fe4S-binding SPASM domain